MMNDHKSTSPNVDTARTEGMPHSTSETRQADKRRLPLRVLVISTVLAVVGLGLVFAYFAN